MVLAERFAANLERALEEPFRIGVLALIIVHDRHVVEAKSHEDVVPAEGLFVDRQCAFVERLRVPRTGLDFRAQ